jgi:transketolase
MADLTSAPLDERSRQLRRVVIRILQVSRRGHLGAAFSLIEVLRVLYDDILHYRPDEPKWPARDRFILSKGHGCLALYPLLAEKGFFPEEELWKFCSSEGILGGHPEHKVPGIEASTGSLGHGLSIGIGFALNARYEQGNQRVFVVIGDGESNEGSVWEAALCAGKHRLANLTVLIDYNKHQSYAATAEVQDLEPLADKWKAFGFGVTEVDGHDVDQLREVLSGLPVEEQKPNAIICHTIKGRGVSYAENRLEWHHKSRISDEDITSLFAALEIS